MKKLIIFDLDGTLLNTIADLGAACNHALAQGGYPLHDFAVYPRLVGNGVNKLIERALPEDVRTEAEVLRLRPAFVEYYNLHSAVHTRPYDGITELLQALHKQGWLLAVASNKYQQATEHLVNHYFPGLFDIVLGEREGCSRKPDPQIVEDILSSLDVDKQTDRVVYVGDSDVDMITARNADIKAIACTWGFCEQGKLQQYPHWKMVSFPRQILDVL